MAISIVTIRKRLKTFENIRSFEELCNVLKMDELKVYTLAKSPKYRVFKIPKKTGFRLIEDPIEDLKYIQGMLNDWMQAVYSIMQKNTLQVLIC